MCRCRDAALQLAQFLSKGGENLPGVTKHALSHVGIVFIAMETENDSRCTEMSKNREHFFLPLHGVAKRREWRYASHLSSKIVPETYFTRCAGLFIATLTGGVLRGWQWWYVEKFCVVARSISRLRDLFAVLLSSTWRVITCEQSIKLWRALDRFWRSSVKLSTIIVVFVHFMLLTHVFTRISSSFAQIHSGLVSGVLSHSSKTLWASLECARTKSRSLGVKRTCFAEHVHIQRNSAILGDTLAITWRSFAKLGERAATTAAWRYSWRERLERELCRKT